MNAEIKGLNFRMLKIFSYFILLPQSLQCRIKVEKLEFKKQSAVFISTAFSLCFTL